MATNRFQNKFSIKNIGAGRFFVKGSEIGRKAIGFEKAMRESSAEGRHTFTRNLSKKDKRTIKELVGEEAKKLDTHSKGISSRAYRRIMAKGRKKMLKGEWSSADLEDLRSVAKAVKAYPVGDTATSSESTPREPRERAANFATDEKTNNAGRVDTMIQRNTKTNIALDEEKNPAQYNPNNVLGQSRKKHIKAITREQPIRGEINQPNSKDVTAKRGNLDNKSDDKVVELDIG